jgi:hypothetical protein
MYTSIFANYLVPHEVELRERWEKSIFRDQLLAFLNELAHSKDTLYRTDLPSPTRVAEAVSHALFSKDPKPRYLVGSKEEVDLTIDRVLTTVRQLNEQQSHEVSKAELVARLEKILG